MYFMFFNHSFAEIRVTMDNADNVLDNGTLKRKENSIYLNYLISESGWLCRYSDWPWG
jgi:hypothetical protein